MYSNSHQKPFIFAFHFHFLKVHIPWDLFQPLLIVGDIDLLLVATQKDSEVQRQNHLHSLKTTIDKSKVCENLAGSLSFVVSIVLITCIT